MRTYLIPLHKWVQIANTLIVWSITFTVQPVFKPDGAVDEEHVLIINTFDDANFDRVVTEECP